MQFVQYLAGQVAVAIENCNLFEESQHLVAYTASVIESMNRRIHLHRPKVESSTVQHRGVPDFGVVESDVRKKPLLSALPQYPALSAILDVTQKHESPVQRQEIELQRTDGSPITIGYSTFLIRDENQANWAAGDCVSRYHAF